MLGGGGGLRVREGERVGGGWVEGVERDAGDEGDERDERDEGDGGWRICG